MLLGLGVVDAEDVVAALEALVVREQDQALCVIVNLRGGLLDDGETLVDAVESLVTQRVGTLDIRDEIGRECVVGLGEVRKDGYSKGLVGRVAELDGSLSVRVAGDSCDAVADEGVGKEMLLNWSVSIFLFLFGLIYMLQKDVPQ